MIKHALQGHDPATTCTVSSRCASVCVVYAPTTRVADRRPLDEELSGAEVPVTTPFRPVYLDRARQEPAPEDRPWRTMPRNAMTIHYSGMTIEAQRRIAAGVAEILGAHLAGDPPPGGLRRRRARRPRGSGQPPSIHTVLALTKVRGPNCASSRP
jgi:hypothetical protein